VKTVAGEKVSVSIPKFCNDIHFLSGDEIGCDFSCPVWVGLTVFRDDLTIDAFAIVSNAG